MWKSRAVHNATTQHQEWLLSSPDPERKSQLREMSGNQSITKRNVHSPSLHCTVDVLVVHQTQSCQTHRHCSTNTHAPVYSDITVVHKGWAQCQKDLYGKTGPLCRNSLAVWTMQRVCTMLHRLDCPAGSHSTKTLPTLCRHTAVRCIIMYGQRYNYQTYHHCMYNILIHYVRHTPIRSHTMA